MSIPSEALRGLLGRRWILVAGALDSGAAAALADCAPDQWQVKESGDKAKVTYSSLSSGVPLVDAPQQARDCAAHVLDALNSSDIDVPAFNKATWDKYAPGQGHISMHRDAPAVGGVIAVFTLYGRAAFTVENQAEFPVSTGDLVLMAGNGWPAPDDKCVRHASSVPIGGERMILTFRHNVNGADGSWWSK